MGEKIKNKTDYGGVKMKKNNLVVRICLLCLIGVLLSLFGETAGAQQDVEQQHTTRQGIGVSGGYYQETLFLDYGEGDIQINDKGVELKIDIIFPGGFYLGGIYRQGSSAEETYRVHTGFALDGEYSFRDEVETSSYSIVSGYKFYHGQGKRKQSGILSGNKLQGYLACA